MKWEVNSPGPSSGKLGTGLASPNLQPRSSLHHFRALPTPDTEHNESRREADTMKPLTGVRNIRVDGIMLAMGVVVADNIA